MINRDILYLSAFYIKDKRLITTSSICFRRIAFEVWS